MKCSGDSPRPTQTTLSQRHRMSCIALNCDCNPNISPASDIVDPVTGEALGFPFVTNQMKENEEYFDSEENEFDDSDLGDSDYLSANAEEAHYAETGDKSLVGTG